MRTSGSVRRAREARLREDWTPPGPVPPGHPDDPSWAPAPGQTLDAFAGHWRLYQLAGGHRFSTDDMLAAWWAIVTCEALGVVPARGLDLGCGIGSVGLWLAWAWPSLHLTGVEAQTVSLELARRSAAYNGVSDRTRWLAADLRDPDLMAAMPPASMDLVTGSPPYWLPETGTLSDAPQKGPCRFEQRGGVEVYLEAMGRWLAPRGIGALVFDGRQSARLRSAVRASGLHLLNVREVVSREGDPPLLLVASVSRPGAFEPGAIAGEPDEGPLLLRHADGGRSVAFRAIRARMGFPPGRV